MAQTYKVDKQTSLQWPRKCVVCGLSEVVSGSAYGSSVDDISLPFGVILKVSEHTLTLRYPICVKHKWFWLGTQFALFLLFLLAAVSIAFLMGYYPDYSVTLWVVAAIASVIFVFLALTLPPVQVFRIRDNYYMLRIRNNSYARDLERANADKLGNW